MVPILAAVIVAAAVLAAAWRIATALSSRGRDDAEVAQLLAMFAPGIAAAIDDPRAFLAWQPLAMTARRAFPNAFATLDRAANGTFPFTPEQIQNAHARWTAEWLAWERTHDAECKLRVATVEHELGEAIDTPFGRARLAAVDRDKLDRYQRRYEEYTRTAKALQALVPKS